MLTSDHPFFKVFMSEFFIPDESYGHLKENAPPEYVQLFNQYLELQKHDETAGKATI